MSESQVIVTENRNLVFPNITNNQVTVIQSAQNQVLVTLTTAIQSGGVGGDPGGSNTQVQFNDSGSFGGDAGFTYNKTTDIATLGGLNVTGLTASQITATDGSKNLQSLTTATYPSLTELSYVKGVTSAIQTQLGEKENAITTLSISKGGTNSSSSLSNNRVMRSSSGQIVEAAAITASRALVSDANGIPVAANTTTTELNYVSGVTSAIQTQLNAKEGTINTLSIAKGGTNSSSALNNNRVMRSSGGSIVEATAITASRALISDSNGIPVHATTTSTEIGFVNGVTSAIQTQLNAKEATITTLPISKGGTNSGTSLNNNRVMRSSSGAIAEAAAITASRALISDANGIPTHSTVTSTELGYVSGVTSAIQTQLNAKATTQQTDFISGYITLAQDKTYKIIVKIPYSCTIINTITICESGTCTATFQINATNISGTANAVSTTEKDETKNDDVSSGDDIQIRISSNAACVGLSYTIVITRTLS